MQKHEEASMREQCLIPVALPAEGWSFPDTVRSDVALGCRWRCRS